MGNDDKPMFVVVIGETGFGKSSLIRLLTSNKHVIARDQGSHKSCTKETAIWGYSSLDDIINKNTFYVDTIGMQDSHMMQNCY